METEERWGFRGEGYRKVHDGTIVTDVPNDVWGTGVTMTWTRQDGYVWVFLAVDHCNSQLIGAHASIFGPRYEALEPIRQAVREHVGEVEQDGAGGIALRHDHGSQYMSRVFQQDLRFLEELRFLGISSTPAGR